MKILAFQHYQPKLAPYACHPDATRGRLYPEAESENRSPYQRDRDRIIHSAAFRRLEYKTQVFVNHEGDHYRTRLTHTLEVSQMARSMARSLGLNEDLAEAVALAHDLGHTPFGHAGEDALDEMMAEYKGFSHNAQTIRILTYLEHRYADFDGLNLTWETLEGIAKHNGPLQDAQGKAAVPLGIAEYNKRHDLSLHTWPSAEAQIAALADDIAYHNHDIDDGLRAGLFTVQDLSDLPLVKEALSEVEKKYPGLEDHRKIHETIRRLINRMVLDLLAETYKRLEKAEVKSVDDIRLLTHPVAAFSTAMQESHKQLRSFLMERMYRHYRVNRTTSKARRVLRELFAFFHGEPGCLPTRWQELTDGPRTAQTARVVADYIAGMTDRFALEEHQRIFDPAKKA